MNSRFVLFLVAVFLLVPGAFAQSPEASDSTDTASSRFDRVDPSGDRLFFKSTARSLGDGHVMVSATNVFLPQVEVGITDAISVEAGVLVLPNYAGDLFTFNPSVRLYHGNRLDVSVDAQAFAFQETDAIFGEGGGSIFPINVEEQWRYSVTPRVHATYGTDVASLTGSVGVPLATSRPGERISGSSDAIVSFAGDLQVLNWLKLISENDVALGLPYRFGVPVVSEQGDVITRTVEGETTAFQTLTGVRFFWDRMSIDVAAGVVAYGRDELSREGTGLLRFSYRF